MAVDVKELPTGYEFPPVVHAMTQERMTVYSDMEHSNTAGPRGRIQLAPKNIHKDLEFARSQGLPNTIADGLIQTAWVEAQLRDFFGTGFLKGGKLMTKYIKPVFAGDTITIKMALKEKLPEGKATRFVIEISCFNQNGDLVTVGSGSGLVA